MVTAVNFASLLQKQGHYEKGTCAARYGDYRGNPYSSAQVSQRAGIWEREGLSQRGTNRQGLVVSR